MKNSKLIVVREYDRIHSIEKTDKSLPEGEPYLREGRDVFISKEHFNELESFVKEYVDYEEADDRYGLDIRRYFGGKKNGKKKGQTKDDDFESVDSFFKIGKNKITISNYVGAIQLPSGIQIDILPKVDLGNKDESFSVESEKETRIIFLQMLRSLGDFSYKVFDSADLIEHNMPLFEVFIYIFLKEVMRLTQIGLKSQYLTETDNLKFFKGKLLVGEHVKRNVAHKECFYVEYDEYSVNRPENRLIKAALEKVRRISTMQINQKMIYQVMPHFDFVEISTNFDGDFNQITLDRTTSIYEEIMIWTEIILRNMGISTFAGSKNARSLLFKMNDLYEAYIYQEFKRAVVRHEEENGSVNGILNWEIKKKAEGEKKYLFDKENQVGGIKDKEKGVFRLEPDIMVKSGGKCIALLDTKWKTLRWSNYKNKEDNHGISNADMYQMFAYSQKYKVEDIWLLYPKIPLGDGTGETWKTSSDGRSPVMVSYESDEPPCTIKVFFTDLKRIKENMDELVEEIVNRGISDEGKQEELIEEEDLGVTASQMNAGIALNPIGNNGIAEGDIQGLKGKRMGTKLIKEKFILAPNANGAELLRSLAKLNVNTIGWRIVNAEELARIALMHSGITVEEEYVNREDMTAMLFAILQDKKGYLENSKTYEDAVQIANAISILRSLSDAKCEDEEVDQLRDALLKETDFPEKNAAILELIEEYLDRCRTDNRVDSIGVTRRALKDASPMGDKDFIVLKEYPLTVLEAALISCVSGDAYDVKEIRELFQVEKQPIMIQSYTKAYGAINEVEGIISRIYKDNDTKPDEWVIACANPKEYAQIFYDVVGRYEVPISFGVGLPITKSKPAELLKLLLDWRTKGQYGIAALKKIFYSDAFDNSAFASTLGFNNQKEYTKYKDNLIKMAGGLRLSFNDGENRKRIVANKPILEKEVKRMEMLPDSRDKKDAEKNLSTLGWIEKFADELALGEISFLSKYCRLRKNNDYARNLDKSAKAAIVEALAEFKKNAPDRDALEIAPHILSGNVYRESAKAGYIHFTSIEKALSEQRRKLWVCGLSADVFPGNPRENHLLLDGDLKMLSAKEDGISEKITLKHYTSESTVEQRKENLDNLINLASDLGAEINLSYNCFDVAQLGRKNPSSVLFSYYKSERPEADYQEFIDDFEEGGLLESIGFFDTPLSDSRLLGEGFLTGCNITKNPDEKDVFSEYDGDALLKRAWSPSSLKEFFVCPRRFYLQSIKGIPNEEEDNTYRLTEGPTAGLLAHHLLEDLAAEGINSITRAEFVKRAETAMSDYFLGRIPLNERAAEVEVKKFAEMMGYAYDKEKELGREVIDSETGLGTGGKDEEGVEHPSGVKLKGFPDRVEKNADGDLIITDIKTEKEVQQIEDDIDSCLQVVVYAWLYEAIRKAIIHHCEYRNLRTKDTISCKYDNEMKGALNEKLKEFKEAIEGCHFERNPGENNSNCKYCTFKGICDNSNWSANCEEVIAEEEENEETGEAINE